MTCVRQKFNNRQQFSVTEIYLRGSVKIDLSLKKSLLLLFLLPICFAVNAQRADLSELDAAIRNKQQYVQQKEQRIAALQSNAGKFRPYDFNKALFEEYHRFRLDSALYFAGLNLAMAQATHQTTEAAEAQLQMAAIYSGMGQYRESEQLLAAIAVKPVPRELLPLYYETWLRFYEHYATSSNHATYTLLINNYRDSLLHVLDTTSLSYTIHRAQQLINNNQPEPAASLLLRVLPKVPDHDEAYAMITYLLANIARKQNKPEEEKAWFIQSALSDTHHAAREQASVMDLALICNAGGDLDRAYAYTRSAIEDAIAGKVEFRTRLIASVFTIINTAYQEREAARKKQLQQYLLFISLLTLFLVAAVIYVYRQMKRMQRMKEALQQSSRQLAALNEDITRKNAELYERNAQLSEANHIKEEYIAHFFDLCSTYISKMENYRKTLNQKATGKKLDDLVLLLRSTTFVDNELEELYRYFDQVFLNLYPAFVKDFNALLLPEEQTLPKQGELLNTELRIFALIRLGITDSVKIASFLRYSLSTIYNYRTRARNKAAVSRDEFEKMVMTIGGNQSF